MSIVADAVRKFDLAKYAESHAGQLVAADEYLLTCPQCGKEKLTVHVKKAAWHCWTCDAGELSMTGKSQGRGGLLDLIQLLDRVSLREAVEKVLAGGRFVELRLDVISDELLGEIIDHFAPERAIEPPQPVVPITGILPYMEKRGITLEDANAFGLFTVGAGRYGGRLVFPVWENGRLVYWQARAMWEAHEQVNGHYIKAINPPRTEGQAVSSDVLMNLDFAAQHERVAIVEGPIDCVKTGPSSVCTFGKKISPRQIAKLIRAGVQAIDFMWDGPNPREPEGAMPEMRAVAPSLAAFFDVRIVRLPYGDPGERTREELDQRRAYGEPFEQFSTLAYL